MKKPNEIRVIYKKSKPLIQLLSVDDAKKFVASLFDQDTIELFESAYLILLDNSNQVIGYYLIGKGNVLSVSMDIRLMFSIALKCNAVSIILSHNHPSGKNEFGDVDLKHTEEVVKAGKLLSIRVLDHILVTKQNVISMSEQNLI